MKPERDPVLCASSGCKARARVATPGGPRCRDCANEQARLEKWGPGE